VQFDSLTFLAFVGGIWLIYQLTPERYRWQMMLVASLGFYATFKAPLLLLALCAVTVLSFELGRRISRETKPSRRGGLLWAGIAANLSILCLVKYWRPIAATAFPSLAPWCSEAGLFVTIGVSYFTLQAISYLADVYLEVVEAEPHLGRFALYLSFFPKLLQGPIERAGDLLPQLKASYRCNYDNMRSGVLLFAWGLFKKTAVANRLAPYVNTIYGDVRAYGGISLMMATYMYAIQVYADFSGYTDMALGVARFFNVGLTQNFNAPYLSSSVTEFWRRWHISFSRWILDYIFRPLQTVWRGIGRAGTAAALLVTFLFSGIWHGVAASFIVWGLLHGLYLAGWFLCAPVVSRFFKRLGCQNHPALKVAGVVLTFHLVCFAWIFFRANSLADGIYVSTHLLSGVGGYALAVVSNFRDLLHHKELWDPILLGKTLPVFLLLLASLAVMLAASLLHGRIRISAHPAWFRWPAYYALVCSIALLSTFDNVGFVYFQF
jgi:D-alanyl-lipoteichoic acid acyltransferase DltB (MBOAT superfamily)